MKKTMTRLLAVLLILGCILAMTACGDKDDDKQTDKEESTSASVEEGKNKEYTLAEGYKLYENDDLSFAYPSSWTLTEGSSPIMTSSNGNNFNMSYELANKENTAAYKSLTKDTFMDLIGNMLVAMGMTVSGVEVETKTNDGGVEIIVCTYDATYVGKQMSFCQYLIVGEDKHYTITATAVVPMDDAVEELFKSIRVK